MDIALKVIEAVCANPGVQAFPSHGNAVLLDWEGSGKTAEVFKQEFLSNEYLTRNLSGSRGMRGNYFQRITIGQREDMEQFAAVLCAFVE